MYKAYMDKKQLYQKAEENLTSFIKAIKDDQWQDQSTCSEWTVRDLVNHLVGENLWLAELLAGKSMSEVGNSLDGDLLGEDSVEAWQESSEKAWEQVDKISDLDKEIELSSRTITVEGYLEEMIFDKTIHGWDVAKSTGQNDELDQELVDYLYDKWAGRIDLAETGVFGPPIQVAEEADKQTKLLGVLGRKG